MRLALSTSKRPPSSPLVLLIRWGVPVAFVAFGVLLLLLSHGHLTGVQDNSSGGNVFTSETFTDRDSMLSAIGVGSIVMAGMVVLLGWMLRLNADDSGDRAKEEDARDYLRRTGHWPSDD